MDLAEGSLRRHHPFLQPREIFISQGGESSRIQSFWNDSRKRERGKLDYFWRVSFLFDTMSNNDLDIVGIF